MAVKETKFAVNKLTVMRALNDEEKDMKFEITNSASFYTPHRIRYDAKHTVSIFEYAQYNIMWKLLS